MDPVPVRDKGEGAGRAVCSPVVLGLGQRVSSQGLRPGTAVRQQPRRQGDLGAVLPRGLLPRPPRV